MSAARWACAFGAVALLTLGIVVSRNLLWLAAPLVATGLLALGSQAERRWTASAWLLTVMLTVAVLNQPAGLFLPASLLALAYWDLEDFEARLSATPTASDRRTLIRRHAAFLLAALALGGGMATIALLGRLQLGFAPAGALALAALVGLHRLIRTGSPSAASR